jgi:DNA polymerase elongation subunit (family B)
MNQEEINEIEERIEKLTSLKNELKNEEQAVKLTMNSIYGALGNQWFVCFNPEVAEAVTLQGQDLIKYSEKALHKYFHEYWHVDKELHEKLGLTTVKRVAKPLVIYGDTDSCFSGTKVIIKYGANAQKFAFDELFLEFSKSDGYYTDNRGNEIIEPDGLSSLNYIDQSITFSPIKKIIRHKVKKPKWKLVTETGKEVIVTNDHSLTVFRDGIKIHIKASEINIDTDLVLEVSVDI